MYRLNPANSDTILSNEVITQYKKSVKVNEGQCSLLPGLCDEESVGWFAVAICLKIDNFGEFDSSISHYFYQFKR